MNDEELTRGLKKFYLDEVVVRQKEMKVAKNLVLSVVDDIDYDLGSDEVKDELGLEISHPIFSGSVWEGVKEGLADEFDLMFPIILDSRVWKYSRIKGITPGYIPYKIYSKQKHLDPWNAHIAVTYGFRIDEGIFELSPIQIKTALREEIEDTLEEDNDSAGDHCYFVEPNNSGPSIVMYLNYVKSRIRYQEGAKDPDMLKAYKKYSEEFSISVDLVPVIKLGEGDCKRLFVGKGSVDGHENVWRESFSEIEKIELRQLDGCQKKILRILKAMKRKGETFLLPFVSYHFKHAILHEGFRGNWDEEHLGKNFKKVLRYLEKCLKDMKLPHAIEKNQNLLERANKLNMHSAYNELVDIRVNNEFDTLL